jgi:quinolinate synthase
MSAMMIAALTVPANARPDPRTMTCEQAQAMVRQSGRIVMTTGANTFAQIVASSGMCTVSSARSQIVSTRDNPRCQIGFVCRPRTGGR